jgi:hypothetical protein
LHGHALRGLCKAQLNGKCPKFAILRRREVAEAGRKEEERRRRRRQRKRDAVGVRHG